MPNENVATPDTSAPSSGAIRSFTIALVLLNLLIIGLALFLPSGRVDPTHYFREFRLVTWFSFLQLLACSYLSILVFRARFRPVGEGGKLNPALLWAVLAGGFLFLALDELFSIHLMLGHLIRSLGDMEKSRYTKWVGDLIMISYAILSVGILFLFRSEILKFRRSWIPFGIAFFFLGATIVFDSSFLWRLEIILPDFFAPIFGGAGRGVTEESFKLLSECFFVIAFFVSLKDAPCSKAGTIEKP